MKEPSFAEPFTVFTLLNDERTVPAIRMDTVDIIVARWLDVLFYRIHLRQYRQINSLDSLMKGKVEAAIEEVFCYVAIIQ